MEQPKIRTAVPKRRYQVADLSLVILGEIEAGDQHTYHYIMAVVPEGRSTPVLYITAERGEGIPAGEPDTVIRVLAESGTRLFGPDDRWRGLDAFATDALAMAQRVMGVADETPIPLS